MTRRPRPVALLGLLALFAGCGEDPTAPPAGTTMTLRVENLAGISPDQGTFEVWVHGGSDTVSVGRITGVGVGAPLPDHPFELPLERPAGIFLTVEPAGDGDARPSRSVVLHGAFGGGRATLVPEGAITDGRAFQPEPGAHSLFTTSNNAEEGYPSAEAAGLWLFTLTPSRNAHGSREVRVTPLRPGWSYEGWIVRQSEPQIWISYGKYRPDELGLLSSRDDTGTGPFAGAQDFRNAGVEDVPGEEWTSAEIADRLGIELPGGLSTPLLLDGVDSEGRAEWHHVITVEPEFDLVEGPLEGRPFPVAPYENPIGPEGPGVPRTILFHGDRLPRGTVAPGGEGE